MNRFFRFAFTGLLASLAIFAFTFDAAAAGRGQGQNGNRSVATHAVPKAPATPAVTTSDGEVWIGGDSIGVGIAKSAARPSVAKSGAFTSAVIKQLSLVPAGSTLYVSSGTNDAIWGRTQLKAVVNRIVKVAGSKNITIVWIGPPKVYKGFDRSSAKLDIWMKSYMPTKNITYFALRTPEFSDRSIRTPDGIHFTAAGYALIVKGVFGP